MTGSEALAAGALAAGIRYAAGYPGSPATKTVEALNAVVGAHSVEWCTNEKVAFEKCLGVSITGQRALVCIKSVGMNIALDPVMVTNMTGVRGGLVILLGDDPGAWGSQNEQDSRLLAPFTELPMLAPMTPQEAHDMMPIAFDWSEREHTPIIIHITRSFSLCDGDVKPGTLPARPEIDMIPITAGRDEQRWFSTPANAVRLHKTHHARLYEIQKRGEASPFHATLQGSTLGVITAGFVGQKYEDVLTKSGVPVRPTRLHLGILYPRPANAIREFLAGLDQVMVLEENAPFVEQAVKAIAQEAGCTVPICGRGTGHIPAEGELFRFQIAEALNAIQSGFVDTSLFPPDLEAKPSPAKQGLCKGCPYDPAFSTLKDVLMERGEEPVFLGDPGCAVRLWQPPLQMLDVKYSMGSCISIGAGIALGDPSLRAIACPGDSSFYHTGISALIDASYHRVGMTVLLLDNGTTALSGCQPHPGVAQPEHQQIPLEALVSACQVDLCEVVDAFDPVALRRAYRRVLAINGLGVLIIRGACALLEVDTLAGGL